MGLLAVVAGYIMINFTVLGTILMEFLQIYTLLMYKNMIKTELYHEISRELLLVNPVLSDATYFYNGEMYTILLVPFLAVSIFGLIGFLVKRTCEQRHTILKKILYEIFVYDIFVTLCLIFVMPLFYNTIQFYTLESTNEISPSSTLGKVGSFASYVNLIAAFSILYLFIYILNPKIGEN